MQAVPNNWSVRELKQADGYWLIPDHPNHHSTDTRLLDDRFEGWGVVRFLTNKMQRSRSR